MYSLGRGEIPHRLYYVCAISQVLGYESMWQEGRHVVASFLRYTNISVACLTTDILSSPKVFRIVDLFSPLQMHNCIYNVVGC